MVQTCFFFKVHIRLISQFYLYKSEVLSKPGALYNRSGQVGRQVPTQYTVGTQLPELDLQVLPRVRQSKARPQVLSISSCKKSKDLSLRFLSSKDKNENNKAQQITAFTQNYYILTRPMKTKD